MKTHLSLATGDLAKSLTFYRTLLHTEPAKALADYALFITEQPALELALEFREHVAPSRDVHYGIYVETAAGVEHAVARFESAGLAVSIEREETCCYANQTKVWATDPDGRRWEVYTVHAETGTASCCAA